MERQASPAAIHADGLARSYGKQGVEALRGISLRVQPGEVFGLLGPNGSGKTTTVKILTTLLPPSGGEARVAGWDVRTDPARVRRSIGVALQDVALDPLLTAWDHMRLQCSLHRVPLRARRRLGTELIARMGLTEAAGRRVSTYSGGMKRRLDLALALVHEPAVLFLDEPTVGLDPQSRLAVWDEVRRLAREQGVAVFLTTQHLEEADALADRVAILDCGEIVASGTPRDLKKGVGERTLVVSAGPEALPAVAAMVEAFGRVVPDRMETVRCHLRQEIEVSAVFRSLESSGLNLETVEIHGSTLEEVFFAKTGRLLEHGDVPR
jgi:ABC-2 type transport system ATP-binding protein